MLAFELYCRTPFSKIHKNNKDIIALASLLGRTPSSVGLKMSNLAHYDPELRDREVNGMSHTSKLDEEIYKEFSEDWEELSYQAQLILAKYKNQNIEDLTRQLGIRDLPEGKDKLSETKARVGQYFFRSSVLAAYRNECCITGIKLPNLLIASHIKPWKDSNCKTERTNPCNGLCLNALHDKAFDKGFITIDENYRIVFSSAMEDIEMDDDTREWFYSYKNKEIVLPDKFKPGKNFIEYHNDVVFLG